MNKSESKKDFKGFKVSEHKTVQGIAIGLFIISLLLLFVAIPANIKDVTTFGVTPRFLPQVYSVLLALLSIWLFFEGKHAKNKKEKKYYEMTANQIKVAVLTIVIMALDIFIMQYLGFMITNAITIAALMWLYGERNIRKILIISIVSVIVINKFFEVVLKLYLPRLNLPF